MCRRSPRNPSREPLSEAAMSDFVAGQIQYTGRRPGRRALLAHGPRQGLRARSAAARLLDRVV